MNEAEPFETAAAASVPEQMVTACNVSASAAPVPGSQTTWTAWTCLARPPLRQLVQKLQNEGTPFSPAERAFYKRSSQCTAARLSPVHSQVPITWRRPVRENRVPSFSDV